MILTDYHTRTSGSLHQLLQRETVRALWLPRPQNTEDYDLMMSCLAVAERFNTPAFIYDDSADLTLFGNATLSVQRSMIERSRMPVLLLRLQTPAETVALCGRSILESDLSLPALVAIAESDTVIFSNYGPKLKQPISCVFGPNVKAIYFANAHMAAYLSPHAYPEDDVTMIIGQGRITLP